MPGGYVVRDANGQAIAYLYSRDNEDEARQAKVVTTDEARRIARTWRGREKKKAHQTGSGVGVVFDPAPYRTVGAFGASRHAPAKSRLPPWSGS
jgi:hypothetical protein